MYLLTAVDEKRHVAEIVLEAEAALLANQSFREEMSRWVDKRISADRDSEARRRLPAAGSRSAGHTPEPYFPPDLGVPMATAAARTFPPGERTAGDRRERIAEAPVIALLATKRDDPGAWIAAGQALQRALLVAGRREASGSYLSAALEVQRLRPRIAQAFSVKDSPQILFRLGYGSEIRPTPRRPVWEVMA
jgi:hypothetical protein